MKGREFAHELKDVSAAGQPVEQHPPGGGRALRRGQLPGRQHPDRSQNGYGSALAHSPPGRVLSRPVGIAPVRDRQDCDDPGRVIDGIESTVLTAPG
jgi:hypothetical protein